MKEIISLINEYEEIGGDKKAIKEDIERRIEARMMLNIRHKRHKGEKRVFSEKTEELFLIAKGGL